MKTLADTRSKERKIERKIQCFKISRVIQYSHFLPDKKTTNYKLTNMTNKAILISQVNDTSMKGNYTKDELHDSYDYELIPTSTEVDFISDLLFQ